MYEVDCYKMTAEMLARLGGDEETVKGCLKAMFPGYGEKGIRKLLD